MMNVQQLQQAARQAQDLCNRLIAQEQQNAAQLNQFGQGTFQNMSQLESNAARDLRQIQQLCAQIEQGLATAAQAGTFSAAGIAPLQPVSYTAPYGPVQGLNRPEISGGTLQQVMQADRNPFTGPWYRPTPASGVQSAGIQGGGVNTAAISQVLQADRQAGAQQSQPAGWYGSAAGQAGGQTWQAGSQGAQATGYSQAAPGVNQTAVQQVLQADRGQGEAENWQRQGQANQAGYTPGYYGQGTGVNQVMQAAQRAN
ncbi:MAG: hypothetical protein IMX06_01930 [Kyrpidia tusciae]|nr:hypothetical protein [Kyrpidia tusciae]MBE3551606.1 hypothetical protein [Kyrpidia tusciae]